MVNRTDIFTEDEWREIVAGQVELRIAVIGEWHCFREMMATFALFGYMRGKEEVLNEYMGQ